MSLIFDNYRYNDKYNSNNTDNYDSYREIKNYEKQRRKLIENSLDNLVLKSNNYGSSSPIKQNNLRINQNENSNPSSPNANNISNKFDSYHKSFNSPVKPVNNGRSHSMNYFNTDIKHNQNNREYNFNSPQELIHSNANFKFYNYFFNYSPALDPFSDNYYLKNPKMEYNKNYRKPSPVTGSKLSYSQDNYLNEKIKQEEKALIGRIERLRALENQYIYKPNSPPKEIENQYQKKYDYKTIYDLNK